MEMPTHDEEKANRKHPVWCVVDSETHRALRMAAASEGLSMADAV
jgi:hypothetical protein